MTSVRKSIKAAKRILRAENRPQDGIVRVMVKMRNRKWRVRRYYSVASIRATAKAKTYKRNFERKIKKHGEWAEYREFVVYQKRVQASMIPPFLLDDSPTMSYKEFRELWDKGRTWNNKQDEQRQAIFRPFDA